MPTLTELGRIYSRRKLLLRAGGLALIGCNTASTNQETTTPTLVPTPQPTIESTHTTVVLNTATSIPTTPTLEATKAPTNAPTATKIPETNTPFPTIVVRTATSRPEPRVARTPTPRLIEQQPASLLWQTTVTESALKPDAKGFKQASFVWTGKSLFVNNSEGVPAQIDFQTKKEIWKSPNRGMILGSNGDNVYFLHETTHRIHAVSTTSKQELWRYKIEGTVLSAGPFLAPPIPQALTLPLIFSGEMIGIHFSVTPADVRFIVVNKKGEYQHFGRGVIKYLSDKMVFAVNSQNIWSQYEFKTKRGAPSGDKPLSVIFVDDKVFTYHPDMERVGPVILIMNTNSEEPIPTYIQLKEKAKPVFASNDLLVLQDEKPQAPNIYTVYRYKNNPIPTSDALPQEVEVISKLQSSKGEYKFIDVKNWLFAAHPTDGTVAFYKDKKVWESEDILGITNVFEANGQLILINRGDHGSMSRPEVAGTLWSTDAQNGKKLSFNPIQFDPMYGKPLLINNKIIISDGRGGERYNLHSVDLQSGKKQPLPVSLKASVDHVANASGTLLAQSDNQLFALKV